MESIYKRIRKQISAKVHRIILECEVSRLSRGYPKALKRIRTKMSKGGVLSVLFVVTEPAKWKCQSVFDAMRASSRFRPYIGVSRPDRHFCEDLDALARDFEHCVDFFVRKGMEIVRLYNPKSRQAIRLSCIDADIVFYQQSWFDVKGQLPIDFCGHSICCYVPYFVPNYGDLRLDSQLPLHRMVYLHFVLNDLWVELYKDAGKNIKYAGKFVGVGHPMLDGLGFDEHGGRSHQCVIYAPHWTINPNHTSDGLNYATFLWNGKEILLYAKRHREMNWVFKPHPNLAQILQYFGVMTKEEVDAYYKGWEEIGSVMIQGDYLDLFEMSSAMVTDSGSFLTEYAATGKPIIHLVSSENTHRPMAPSARLYSTYYQVHNLDEMYRTFGDILERRNDPKMIERHAAVRKANLAGNDAAKSIVDCLIGEISNGH